MSLNKCLEMKTNNHIRVITTNANNAGTQSETSNKVKSAGKHATGHIWGLGLYTGYKRVVLIGFQVFVRRGVFRVVKAKYQNQGRRNIFPIFKWVGGCGAGVEATTLLLAPAQPPWLRCPRKRIKNHVFSTVHPNYCTPCTRRSAKKDRSLWSTGLIPACKTYLAGPYGCLNKDTKHPQKWQTKTLQLKLGPTLTRIIMTCHEGTYKA